MPFGRKLHEFLIFPAHKMFVNLSSFVYFDLDYSAKIHYEYAGPLIQWMPDTFAPPTEKPSEVGQ